MTNFLSIEQLKIGDSSKSPLLRAEVDQYDYDDYYDDDDDESHPEEIVTFDLVYPKSRVHIDGYNLFFIGSGGFEHYQSIGCDEQIIKPYLDLDKRRSLKIIGVDIV